MIDGLLLMAITYSYNILSMANSTTVEVHLPMIDGLLFMAITYSYNILSMATTVRQ